MKTASLLIAALIAIFSTSSILAENWPAWRGADGRGISSEKDLPLKWSDSENIVWKAPLPEMGNSTPIIWGDRVFLTQAVDGGKQRTVIAFDRKNGQQLWQQGVACDTQETTHRQNPPCSSSAVTDGKAIYANFASGGVVAYDFNGKQLWHRKLGPVLHKWGNGGSPVIYKDTLIVLHGPGTPTFLTALDRETGDTVWKTDEVGINSPIFGSWSTPVLINTGKRDELVLPLPGAKIGGIGWFKGYDPATGKELWKCDGLGNEIYAMPIIGDGGKFIVGISGHKGPTTAVRTGGSGDVTASHQLWTHPKNAQRIGSGIIDGDYLFISDANGIAECLKARTGELVWKERLGGNLWGSILLGDGKLYASNHEGDTFVLKAGPKFKLLAKNTISEPTYAALAPSDGQLFLRTYNNLYCIGR